MRRRNLHYFIALLAASVAAVAAPLPIELALEPAKTLPALPVSFHVTVSTESAKPVVVPVRAILVVTPRAGETFIAGWEGDGARGSRLVADLSPWVDAATVRKGSPATFTIPVDWTLTSPAWFADSRLSVPGVYSLRLVLDDDLTDDLIRRRQPADLIASSEGSGHADLTVEEPLGLDAQVWALLQASSRRPFTAAMWTHASEAARTIWTDYPGSTYARYVAAKVPGTAEQMIAAARRGIEMNPAGPLRESLELYAADREMLAYAQTFAKNPARARAHAEEAMKILSGLAERGREPRFKKLAAARLADVRERIEADFEE